MGRTVGIDIGGSSVAAVVRDVTGDIVSSHRKLVNLDGGQKVADATVAALEALDSDDFDAVGVGVPGHVDRNSGRVSLAVNLGIGSEPFDLAGALGERVSKPVVVENDVRTAALGANESLTRGGRPVESLTVVSIGTGISAGVVVNGSLLRGAHGMAGEIGHVVVDESGPICACGQRGCLEAVAAGPAIGRIWPRVDGKEPATALFTAAADGDAAARTVAYRICDHLTTALIWMAATYDSEVIVLAGGVPSAGQAFLDMVRDRIAERAAASELAARRLPPEQVILADPFDPPGPRGAALLAANEILQEKGKVPSATKANNQ